MMDYDSENSTILDSYSAKQSLDNMRENYPLGYFGLTVTVLLPVVGFISNCVVFDLLCRAKNASTVFLWLKQMVFWGNNVHLMNAILSKILFLLRIYLLDFSRVTCKTLFFCNTFTLYAAFAHCPTLFVDQTLFLLNPTWHHQREWKKVIPKCSVAIAIFSFLYSLPYIAIVDFRKDSCEITHQTLNTAIFFHSVSQSIS